MQRQGQDKDLSSKIRVVEIKTKINGKHIGKGQRRVSGEMGWEGSQGASVRIQHLSVV